MTDQLALDEAAGCPGGHRALLDVFVPGRPAPQGSKRHVGKGIMIEMSKHVAPWRTDIREAVIAARKAYHAATIASFTAGAPAAGPMLVRLEFVMPRPAGTPKRRTPAAVKRPDCDKLARAVLDAVGSAGCVWVDDSQVVDLHATKRIAEPGEAPGCRITIHTPASQP
ncbi:MAG TPA: RusA family crossover junction endodeoxyribonuclease [Pseudonocardiaceae bacterium]|nr:RusA family crossover junction endodeoxyribonuclease [Pseudonocardiaceae bacterium]